MSSSDKLIMATVLLSDTGERFIFVYDAFNRKQVVEAIQKVNEFVVDPELDFTWDCAAAAVSKILQASHFANKVKQGLVVDEYP